VALQQDSLPSDQLELLKTKIELLRIQFERSINDLQREFGVSVEYVDLSNQQIDGDKHVRLEVKLR